VAGSRDARRIHRLHLPPVPESRHRPRGVALLSVIAQLMNDYKQELLDKISYTDLVYGRINKKLETDLSNDEIQEMILEIIKETDPSDFQKTGKNVYITNTTRGVRLTINSYTSRIITADILKK
jgi:Tfp pilus assembly ATPase PilU